MLVRYFADIEVGERFDSPSVTLTESMILDFALRYDPQSFHIEKTFAETGPYEGLIASGLHTLALAHRIMLDGQIISKSSIGASGMDEVRWLKPVRPGDTLKVRSEVLEKHLSKSRQDRGRFRTLFEVKNQHQEVVMSFIVTYILGRLPADESSKK